MLLCGDRTKLDLFDFESGKIFHDGCNYEPYNNLIDLCSYQHIRTNQILLFIQSIFWHQTNSNATNNIQLRKNQRWTYLKIPPTILYNDLILNEVIEEDNSWFRLGEQLKKLPENECEPLWS